MQTQSMKQRGLLDVEVQLARDVQPGRQNLLVNAEGIVVEKRWVPYEQTNKRYTWGGHTAWHVNDSVSSGGENVKLSVFKVMTQIKSEDRKHFISKERFEDMRQDGYETGRTRGVLFWILIGQKV